MAQLGETISCAGDHLLKRPTGYPERQHANRQSSVKHLQPSLDLPFGFLFCSTSEITARVTLQGNLYALLLLQLLKHPQFS